MQKPYIELRQKAPFGETVDTYFKFLKYNIKPFLNLYIRYNIVGIVLCLGCAYLLINGFFGLAATDFRYGLNQDSDISSAMYIGFGAILCVLTIGITSFINYSLTSSYIVQYVKTKNNINNKAVGRSISNNLGTALLFLLIGVGFFIVYFLIVTISAFIPFANYIIQYGLNFTLSAIFGFTFVSIFMHNKGIGEALGEGWNFTFTNYPLILLYGLIIGILNLCIFNLIVSLPSISFGIYSYFFVVDNSTFYDSTATSVIFTLFLSIILVAYIFITAISQLAYGVLYFNMLESKNSLYLQSKIDDIGSNE